MAAPPSAQVTVRRRGQVQARLQDHILAWARDTRSGRLRYIMELSELERGAACGCTCALKSICLVRKSKIAKLEQSMNYDKLKQIADKLSADLLCHS